MNNVNLKDKSKEILEKINEIRGLLNVYDFSKRIWEYEH